MKVQVIRQGGGEVLRVDVDVASVRRLVKWLKEENLEEGTAQTHSNAVIGAFRDGLWWVEVTLNGDTYQSLPRVLDEAPPEQDYFTQFKTQ